MSDLALQVRPPAKRGDVAAVTRTRRPGVLVLVDGVFQNALSVGHAELREALNLGWEVWGLSSMGAIRAREMHVLGMRGWGRVFETFMAPGDFQDDEVALLHGAEKPYVALSEPLIHLRAATAHLAEIGILSPSAADQILALETDLNQFFVQTLVPYDPDDVTTILRHPRTVLSFSDSGAHVSQMSGSGMGESSPPGMRPVGE